SGCRCRFEAEDGIRGATVTGVQTCALPIYIYSMVGLWEDSIASNRSALEVQRDYYHATDFTVYAHLQLAQDTKAKALVDEMYKADRKSVVAKDNLANLGAYTALAVIPARYALERA